MLPLRQSNKRKLLCLQIIWNRQKKQSPEDLYTSDYEVGQDNLQGLGLDIHNPVFLISSVTIALFVLVTLLMPDQAAERFSALRFYLSKELDWFFMYSMNGFLIFLRGPRAVAARPNQNRRAKTPSPSIICSAGSPCYLPPGSVSASCSMASSSP